VIDLGAAGKLIHPVKADGKWYYHWDRSGDGTSDNTGSLSGGVDYVSHTDLKTVFNKDASGVACTTISATCRHAVINKVKVALPGIGASGVVEAYLTDNQTYTDLAEVWDSANSGIQTNGTPTGWREDHYWTAIPTHTGSADTFAGRV